MTPERWSRISSLFDALVDTDQGEWDRLLSEAGADADDRDEVLSLLSHARETTGATARHAVGQVAETLFAGSGLDAWIGKTLGPWKLTGTLGEGGMGVVFAASHTTLPLTAAVKLIRRTLGGPEVEARFLKERRILSRLEHPNIARILDGGTEEGLPYFVMERIEGRSLMTWCREASPSLQDKLRLFVKLCAAVQYAHQNLVVHRDLKPGNVMVTREDDPKLLDFGIARSLDPQEGDDAAAQTSAVMTPEYASPEQVRGEPISTATDVYALGAILFELLTGRRAQTLASHADLIAVVCERPVPLPSTCLADRAQADQVRGDLDTIVSMAMRKEPPRRYPSAGELGEDIQRYLNRQPVRARKDTLSYRSLRFLQRNTLAVGLAASALFFLLVGAAGMFILAEQRAVEAARAEKRLLELRQLANRFLFEFDAAIAPIPGTTTARELVVGTAQEYLAGMLPDAVTDAGLAAELATAYEKLGDLQGSPSASSLGKVKDGVSSYEKALALREKGCVDSLTPEEAAQWTTPSGPTGSTEACRARVRTLANLAPLYAEAGETQKASDAATRAVQLAKPLETSSRAQDRLVAGEAHLALAECQRDYSSVLDAIASYERGIAQVRHALQLDPHLEDSRRLTHGLDRLSSALSDTGAFDASARAQEEASQIREAELAAKPDDARLQRRVLVSAQAAANLAYHPEFPSLGDLERGRRSAARMLALAESLFQKDPKNTTAASDLARAHYVSGGMWLAEAPEKALLHHQQGLELTQVMGEGADGLYGRAFLLRVAAVAARRAGKLPEAATFLSQARAAHTRYLTLANGRDDFMDILLTTEEALQAAVKGAHAEADSAFARAAEIGARMTKRSPKRLDFRTLYARALERAAEHAAAQGRAEQARALHQQQLEVWRDWHKAGPSSPYSQQAQAHAQSLL